MRTGAYKITPKNGHELYKGCRWVHHCQIQESEMKMLKNIMKSKSERCIDTNGVSKTKKSNKIQAIFFTNFKKA